MNKLRMITLATAISSALCMGSLTSFAVGPSMSGTTDHTTFNRATSGANASMLANPGAYGTTLLSGTGMATNYPNPTNTPFVGANNGSTPQSGIGGGIGANIGGLGVGIGANIGGTGSNTGITTQNPAGTMTNNSQHNNTNGYNQMTDRNTIRGMGTQGLTGNYDSSSIRNYGVNTTATRTMNWGWLGLLGLVGLAGIRTSNRMQNRQEANR